MRLKKYVQLKKKAIYYNIQELSNNMIDIDLIITINDYKSQVSDETEPGRKHNFNEKVMVENDGVLIRFCARNKLRITQCSFYSLNEATFIMHKLREISIDFNQPDCILLIDLFK